MNRKCVRKRNKNKIHSITIVLGTLPRALVPSALAVGASARCDCPVALMIQCCSNFLQRWLQYSPDRQRRGGGGGLICLFHGTEILGYSQKIRGYSPECPGLTTSMLPIPVWINETSRSAPQEENHSFKPCTVFLIALPCQMIWRGLFTSSAENASSFATRKNVYCCCDVVVICHCGRVGPHHTPPKWLSLGPSVKGHG